MASSAPASTPASVPPRSAGSVLSLLRSFQTSQSTRMGAYARFKQAFKQFMDEREAWEEQAAKDAEKRAKESTLMLKGGMSEGSKADAPVTLASIREAAELAERSQPKPVSPERVFQLVCVEVMAQFQQVSKDVRVIIDALLQHALGGVHPQAVQEVTDAIPAAATSPAALEARRWSVLLQSLQQLEKLKLELTIHQQMLHNQRYVLAHPQAHGQVHEHSHHVHSATDAQGRVRPKHPHTHPHAALASVSEDQELEDNAQPFTRHLSALLSDTAHDTQSPFLFPPSGAAPPSKPLADVPSSCHATLHPERSADAEESFQAEVADLREQEGAVVGKINEILLEVREHVMEAEEEEEEEEEPVEAEEESKSATQVSRSGAAAVAPVLPSSDAPARPRVHVRAAQLSDAAALGSVHARAWQAGSKGLTPDAFVGPYSVPFRQQQWRDRLQAREDGTVSPADDAPRSVCVLVALHPGDGRVCGMLTAGVVRAFPDAEFAPPPAGACELTSMNVEPEAWGSGAAQALMHAALACMRDQGYTDAVLWTMQDNARAIRFYEKEGWTLDGVSREDKAEEPHFVAVRMQRSLRS